MNPQFQTGRSGCSEERRPLLRVKSLSVEL